MTVLAIGGTMFVLIVAVFYFKDRLHSPALTRLAYSEPVARLAVIAFALMFIGVLVVIGDLLA